MNLAPAFLKLPLANPLVLASGILGTTGANLASIAAAGAGAVTSKSIWLRKHAGHPNPTILDLGGGNLINAVGLPHGGIAEARIEIENFRRLSKAPLFASIAGGTINEYSETVAAVAALAPDLIEINISCPNVGSEFGEPFECDQKAVTKLVTSAKKKTGAIPLAVKISANFPDFVETARAAEAAGADAITAINSVGPGMVIDIETAQPILANRVGGLTGPAIRPLAVRAVFEIFRAVQIPIIGTGGVSNARDAVEMMQAGATLVGIGSAVIKGTTVFRKITRDLEKWCAAHKISQISQIVGSAHQK